MKYSTLIAAAMLAVIQLGCSESSSTEPSTTSTTSSVLAPKTLALAVGDSAQVRAVAVASDNTQRLVTTSGTWVSANASVASVTNSGIVTARAQGTADITVAVSEGTATVTVTVTNVSQPMTFIGAVAAPSTETGTLRFTAAAPPRLAGDVYFKRGLFSLLGRVDEQTRVVDLDGGGYRFLGVMSGNVVSGAYVDSLGLTGGFTAIDATHNAVTAFCGSYTSDGSTALGNADAGALAVVISSDGTAAASALTADASGAPQTFVGGISAGQLSLVTKTGEALAGSFQGETASGTFTAAGGASATFSLSYTACR